MEITQTVLEKKIKLRKHTTAGETGNVSRLEFTFLDKNNECLFDLHYCKDFWNEIFYAAKYNIVPFPIYEWEIELEQVKKLNYPNEPIKILLINKYDPDFLKKDILQEELNNTINLLNEIEKANSMTLTEDGSIEELDNDTFGILINLSIDWFDSPSKMSLLGLLVRNCRKYNGSDVVDYIRSLDGSNAYKSPEAYILKDPKYKDVIIAMMNNNLEHIKYDDKCIDFDCSNLDEEKTIDENISESDEYAYWKNIHNYSGFQTHNVNLIKK